MENIHHPSLYSTGLQEAANREEVEYQNTNSINHMILRYLAKDKTIQTYPVVLPIIRSSPPNKLNCMTSHNTACHMFVNS